MRPRVLTPIIVAALLLTPGFRATVQAQTPPCGSASAPQCDGDCPFREACEELGSYGVCHCLPRSEACGALKGPPECWGECPESTACINAGGICECQVVPALSPWGIITMAMVTFGGVLVVHRRRFERA